MVSDGSAAGAPSRPKTWSFSRVNSFDDCPYRWYLNYVCKAPKSDTFFASYGTFMHELIAKILSGALTPEEAANEYTADFRQKVQGAPPSLKVFSNYFAQGVECFLNWKPLPFVPKAIEQRVKFKVGALDCIGYIDLVGEQDGKLVVVDHKSKDMKPRTLKPSKTNQELDAYIRQLYLYAHALKESTGTYPDELIFHCYRTGTLIREPFKQDALLDALHWFEQTAERIEKTSSFFPSPDFFRCNYLCEMNQSCEFFEML